jgi:ribonuclease HI
MVETIGELTKLDRLEIAKGQTEVAIFTDGACIDNPGPGGYAALIRFDGKEDILVGGEPATTNNRMELMGAIKALEYLPPGASAVVHSDSKYVVNGASKWLADWKARGWRKGDRKPVLNRDLWETIDGLCQSRNVKWQWVPGHAGHPENEKVDGLANAEAQRQQLLLELGQAAEQ